MDVKKFYTIINGDYDGVMSRLLKEERVEKFVLMFVGDSSYKNLADALAASEYKEAFRAAHTLKGVCQNLSFTELYNAASEITEALRGASDGGEIVTDGLGALLSEVTKKYNETINAIENS